MDLPKMIDPKVQQLLDFFQEQKDRAAEQAHRYYVKSHFSGLPEHPVCKDQASCHALSNRSAAFYEAMMEVRRIFMPEFFTESKESIKVLKLTDAKHSKLRKKIVGLEQRLGNPKFLVKASDDIKEKSRAELKTLQEELASYGDT